MSAIYNGSIRLVIDNQSVFWSILQRFDGKLINSF